MDGIYSPVKDRQLPDGKDLFLSGEEDRAYSLLHNNGADSLLALKQGNWCTVLVRLFSFEPVCKYILPFKTIAYKTGMFLDNSISVQELNAQRGCNETYQRNY